MKKILFFIGLSFILGSCEPEVEVVYREYDNLPTNQNPDEGGGEDDPNLNQDIQLMRDGEVLYNPSLGYLNLTNAHIEVNGGNDPTHIAIRLFENGRELNPAGYWHFEKHEGYSNIWIRPVQIELVPYEIYGSTIGVQVFAKYENVTGFQLVAWDDNVPVQQP